MKKLKLTVHSDAGHGWLAVKRSLLAQLGIEHQVSSCSYQRGQTVYLEEDCDAGLFIKAYARSRGYILDDSISSIEYCEIRSKLFDFKDSYKQYSPIRSYESYRYSEKIVALANA